MPPAQSEAFRDVCVAKGIKHEYFAFEGEGHGFRKASSIITAYEAELKFYGGSSGIHAANVTSDGEIETRLASRI